MLAHYFEFEFEHQGITFHADCHVYILKGQTEMPYQYPMYRIAINHHKLFPDVFLFYEVNKPGKRFFAYPFVDSEKAIADSILKKLLSFNYRDGKFETVLDFDED